MRTAEPHRKHQEDGREESTHANHQVEERQPFWEITHLRKHDVGTAHHDVEKPNSGRDFSKPDQFSAARCLLCRHTQVAHTEHQNEAHQQGAKSVNHLNKHPRAVKRRENGPLALRPAVGETDRAALVVLTACRRGNPCTQHQKQADGCGHGVNAFRMCFNERLRRLKEGPRCSFPNPHRHVLPQETGREDAGEREMQGDGPVGVVVSNGDVACCGLDDEQDR